MGISRQKGMKDIFLEDMIYWQYIESNIRNICKSFNIQEIRTPVLEATELFARGVGNETDIVNKEMYTFEDKGARSVTLRPELTAGVVRAYIENGLSSYISPLKLWYTGNMYRYEKMQKGRYREFAQFGVEIFGSDSYLADIETINVSYDLIKKIGLENKVELSINSIGCSECRTEYINKLKNFVKLYLDNMCETCKIRYEKNPMRLIDCKEDKCKKIMNDAPMITDNLCANCETDFTNLGNMLNKLKIPYVIDKKIVRGLDYYNKTVYEYTSKDLGLAVGGGGRYDGLVNSLGGASTPAVGFGIGIDRLVLLLKEYNLVDLTKKIDIYFALLCEEAYVKCGSIISSLREKGYSVDLDLQNRSFKAQLKYANKINARYVCIIGENEINNNICILRNMEDSTQTNVSLSTKEIINNI